MKENLLKIINHYGLSPQLKYFQSEIYELNEAIIRYDEGEGNWFEGRDGFCELDNGELITETDAMKNHIKEEIGDVLCMLRQFQYYYGFTDEEIDDIVKYKVNRQLERMRNDENN